MKILNADNQGEGAVIVNANALGEAIGYPSGLVVVNQTVSVELDLVQPSSANGLVPLW